MKAFLDGERARRPRAAEVARLAQVSESAVSRTFRDGSVSTHVRARVQAAARQLGYRPNKMASAVITRRSNVIAILMTTNTNAHFPEVLPQLSHAAEAAGLRTMLFTVDNPDLVPAAIDQIVSYQVDGVLSLTEVAAPDARILAQNGVELLLYNRTAAPYPADLVSCDHRDAGRTLGRHLLGLGHRRFGIVEGPRYSVLATERAGGVIDALADAGIPRAEVPTASGDFGYDSGRAAAATILSGKRRPTAMVCISDLMAIGAIDEASARGIAVPQALSVAGFDGVSAGRWDRYRLTTMRQPLPQLAAAAIELIERRLGDAELARETRVLACSLVTGGSTAPPPAP